MAVEHFDVLVVGAGLSGIGAGYHLQNRCPGKSYAILEGREAIGGTWDLFRYPGIRSDSDMYTLGYAFRPWTEAKAIADGPAILSYVRDTATQYGINRHIRFGQKVRSAAWSTPDAAWTVKVERSDGAQLRYTCNFLFLCAGYYDYDQGHDPEIAGRTAFPGQIIHPQFWPQDLDYGGKQVVVIGSGATAVTIVPEMAKTAGHVTMLQRSPTYVVSRPSEDALANRLRKFLPSQLVYQLIRWRNVLFGLYFFNLARKKPEQTKAHLVRLVKHQLGEDYDVETHFTPRYNPWDQRLCLVPDADLFEAIRNGSAEVVTGQIDRFVETGIKLTSGQVLPADIIVTATGLKLLALGGLVLTVDGQKIDPAQTMAYKGLMFSGVPNLASAFGYTNASWTLKADLTCEYVCRLLKRMAATGMRQATPERDPGVEERPWLDFTSGYVQRAVPHLPKQGAVKPWRLNQNYALDMMALRFGRIDDGVMTFSNPRPAKARAA